MAEHHLGAIDFELSKFKNKSRIEGYRAAYFKDDEHHSGSMTFVFRGPLEPVVYARYPYEEEMVFEVGYIGLINDEISFRPYKKLPYVGRYTAEKVTEMMNEDSFKPDPNELGRVRCFIHKQKEVLAWAHDLGYTCSFSNVEYVTDADGKSIPTIYSRIRRRKSLSCIKVIAENFLKSYLFQIMPPALYRLTLAFTLRWLSLS